MTILLVFIAAVLAGGLCAIFNRKAGPIIGAVVVAGIIQFFITVWALPTIGFFYAGTWIWIVVALVIGSLFACVQDDSEKGARSFAVPSVILVVLWLLSFFASAPILHTTAHNQLIGTVETKVFSEDMPIVDATHIRLVPKETALTLAKKVLGQAKDGNILGSQLEIDKSSVAIQEVQGELWWILPLDFSGFFQWNNRKVVPGYIRVSAQDPTREAQLIDADPVSGKSFELKYTRCAYLGSSLKRNVYFKYPTIARQEFTFEVDDNWYPYYVISATHPTIGFMGYQTEGVIIADPQTGEMSLKKGGDIPEWVDRVKPLEQALEQAQKWGSYSKGWWNAVFAKRDIQKPTSYSGGQDMWFIKKGDTKYWFTGMTSYQSTDQSLVGMMFIDTRATKGGNAIYYSMQGTDENGVVEAADSSLGADSARWQPAQPIPYNVYGTPTWVLPIVSSEGIFQKVTLVSVDNINILATETTLDRAFARYRTLLTQRGNEFAPTGMSDLKQIGPVRVVRVGDTVLGGDKTFFLMVENQNDKIFTSSGEVDDTRLVAVVEAGDMVYLSFLDTQEPMIPLEKITIEGIELKVSSVQEAYDAQREISKKSEDEITQTRDIETEWDKLSPEEKRDLWEKIQEASK